MMIINMGGPLDNYVTPKWQFLTHLPCHAWSRNYVMTRDIVFSWKHSQHAIINRITQWYSVPLWCVAGTEQV